MSTVDLKKVDDALVKAKQALAKGQFEQVLLACKNPELASLSDQHKVEFEYIKAVTYRYLKRFDEAQQSLSLLLSLSPQHARGHQEQGHLFVAQNINYKAVKAFYDATLINPALIGSWKALVSLYQSDTSGPALEHVKDNISYWGTLPKPVLGAADLMFSGNLEQADNVCRQFLQQQKHHVDGLYVLALIDIQTKSYDEAEFLLESCCELAPQHYRARAEYAALLNRIGKYHLALTQANSLLEQSPEQLSYQVLKGIALVGLGDVFDGVKLFEHVLSLEEQRPSLWVQLGHARKSLGQMDEAIAAYKKALELRSDYGDAYWSLANTKSYHFAPTELKQMEALVNESTTLMDDRIHLSFALGKGYEDQGDAIKAFECYQQGNRDKYELSQYQPAHFSRQVDRNIAFFTKAFFEQFEGSGCRDASPIFIVGLPRAGSTLLEQILSSHSQVDATQELHNILSLAKRLMRQKDYPDMLSQIEKGYFERFGQQYIEQTRAYRDNGFYFIDKMPNNFLHIGLIKLILPNAKVIDARRDPMDCCYSCYKQLFAEGQDFTYDQEAVGLYYRDYQKIMEHWDDVLPGFVLRVTHEDVLDDLEGQVKRILAFCRLDFESVCLTYYNNKRAIQTPSAAQVRKPINKDGVGRWKAVETMLEPMKQALYLK